MDRLTRQAGWYRNFAEAWQLRRRLEHAGGPVAARAKLIRLPRLDRDAKSFSVADLAEKELLERRLSTLSLELSRLQGQSRNDPRSAAVAPVVVPFSDEEARADRLSTASEAIETVAERDPQLGLALAAAPDALTIGADETAGSEAVARSAPRGGPLLEFSQRVRQRRERLSPSWSRLRGSLWRSRQLILMRAGDIAVTAGVLLVSSLVYAGTLYTDDWGTLVNCVAAFGAGFVGDVAIKWGLLPAGRSILLRAREAADTPA